MFPVLYRNIFPVIAYIYINYVSVAATTLIGKFFRYAPVGRCGPSVLHFWPYPALCAHNILWTRGEGEGGDEWIADMKLNWMRSNGGMRIGGEWPGVVSDA